VMAHPDHQRLLDGMVAYALGQTSEKAPVYSAVREYHASVGSSLERYGFRPTAQSEIYVRQLAVRSPQPSLVPAKLVGG
jgi:hypothetical protein